MDKRTTSSCPVCAGDRAFVFNAVVLGKYNVSYYFCSKCGLLQTEKPFWLKEAYASAIADFDTDIVARNIWCARRVAGLLYLFLGRKGSGVDLAGGYGLLTRLLRDAGFDFYWSDRSCENRFAIGFEAKDMEKPRSVVTAFEVLEHLENPVEFLRRAMEQNRCDTVLFTTQLFSGAPPAPGKWSSYAFLSGQHISFFRRSTLAAIAKNLNATMYTTGQFHMITRRGIPEWAFRLLAGRMSIFVDMFVRSMMQSRTEADRERIERGLAATLERRDAR